MFVPIRSVQAPRAGALALAAFLIAGAESRAHESGIALVPAGPPLEASDAEAGANFGHSVALEADTAVIGAPLRSIDGELHRGAAYVFVREAGEWVQVGPPLVASDGAEGDRFGSSVAIAENAIVVGAPRRAVGDEYLQGAAYVFVKTSGAWTQAAVLTASDGAAEDGFGSAVAASSDWIVVGAPGRDTHRGAVYAFVARDGSFARDGDAWESDDGRSGDLFGTTLALFGETAVVGAPVHTVNGNAYQGAGYVFVREEGGWRQSGPALIAADGQAFDQLGPCALFEDTVLLGAPLHPVGANPQQGRVLAFSRAGDAWIQSGQPWTLADGSAEDAFGTSVALWGDRALVLAAGREAGDGVARGAVFLFERAGSTWTQAREPFVVGDASGTETLGPALALSGDTGLVGAPFRSVGGNVWQGASEVLGVVPAARPVPSSENDAAGCGCRTARNARAPGFAASSAGALALLAFARRLSARRRRASAQPASMASSSAQRA